MKRCALTKGFAVHPLAACGAELSEIGRFAAEDVKEVTSNIVDIALTIRATRHDGLFTFDRIAMENLLEPYAISIQPKKQIGKQRRLLTKQDHP